VEVLKGLEAQVVGVSAIIYRGKEKKFAEELRPLLSMDPPTWSASDCPLCKKRAPIDRPGQAR
jgi:hypothetical protein